MQASKRNDEIEMGAFNNLNFRHRCPLCSREGNFLAQFKAGSDFGGEGEYDRFHDYTYRIGDKLPWYASADARNNWPSETHSFVRRADPVRGPSYVIDDGIAHCPNCSDQLTFYILISNRRIMRIVGCEKASLNALTIVYDDGRVEQAEYDYDDSNDPPQDYGSP